MGRIAKKSDLVKKDLNGFSIGLVEARNLKIRSEDLKGIVEIIPNEKYKVRATTGKRKAETFEGTLLNAIKRRKELEKENDEIIPISNELDIMFMDAVQLYLNYLKQRVEIGDIDINTMYDHSRRIDTDIKYFFQNYKLFEIDTEVVEKFLSYLRNRDNKNKKNQKLTEQTISGCYRTLNALFNYLKVYFKKRNIIFDNPATYATNKPKPKKNKKELNYFRIDDAIYALKCIDKYANIRLKTFINVIFSLGCRREETCGLKWSDIDFNTGEVNFNTAVTSAVPKGFLKSNIRVREKNLKTDNSYRTNYLSDSVIKCLKKYYAFKTNCGIKIEANDFIFTNYREGRNIDYNFDYEFNDNIPTDPNKLSNEWRNFKKEYNIKDVDLHRIRHTVANILERNGVPKKDIAKMFGNTERVLEEYYTHVDTDELIKMRNTIDDKLFDSVEYINIPIDLVVKILNNYPIDSLEESEMKILDKISSDSVDNVNYDSCINMAKDIILTNYGQMSYFIDDNENNLKIKVETFKKFNTTSSIKIKRQKEIAIIKNVFKF